MKKITIIGAGLGGLSAGALLAKDGYKVTILEQHNIVGGCATVFKRGDFTCEVGLHEMDGVYDNPQIVEVFKKLKVYDGIEFIKPDEFFYVKTKNSTFTMPDGVQNAKNALIEKFPKEKSAIESYFDLIKKISDNMEKLMSFSWYHYLLKPSVLFTILSYKSKSVTDVFDKLFNDSELKLILNANVQYYNDSPNTLSFLIHAVGQHSYLSGGGWFVKGGSQQLSNHFAEAIKSYGGDIITKATVTACSDTSVEYTKKGETVTLDSDIVVSNLSPQQTYELYNTPYQEKKEIGNSLLTIYLGFSKNIKEHYGKRAYSSFFFNDIATVEEFDRYSKKDIFQKVFIFADYSQIDSGLTQSSKSFGSICFMDNIDEWKDLDKQAYKEKKAKLIEVALEKLEQEYPDISSLVEYAEVGTAKTVQRYTKTPQGTAYGYKPTPKQFFRVPKVKSNKVNNLYFVGQWVIAGGFSPAIMSGNLCYKEIVKKHN